MKEKKRSPSKDELELKKKFYELMFELDLYNKFKKTYYLKIIKETNYGFYAHLYLATGLSYKRLQEKKEDIEDNLNCMWIMKTKNFREYAEIQIVLRPIDENMEFKNPKIKPNELYLGLSFSNQLQKNNSNDDCMYLLSGGTGSGKTRYMYQVLLSWIMSCSPEDVWIYLADVAKNEYIQFQNVKHVKYYASDLDELYKMMNLISKEIKRRDSIITKCRANGGETNIEEYNKLNKSKKLAYCYVVIDEFSIIQTDKSDSKEDKEKKEYILAIISKFAKLGRSYGMFLFTATQKTTRVEMPIIVKNMSSVRISFRANDVTSSEVVMGSNIAMGLPKRVAVYSVNGGSDVEYLYSPNLITENGSLQKMLKPYIKSDSINKNNSQQSKNNDIEAMNTKITRIPKGVNAREYLNSLTNKKASLNKGDYNDYGS